MSNATCLIWPRLFYALFIVSRITIAVLDKCFPLNMEVWGNAPTPFEGKFGPSAGEITLRVEDARSNLLGAERRPCPLLTGCMQRGRFTLDPRC